MKVNYNAIKLAKIYVREIFDFIIYLFLLYLIEVLNLPLVFGVLFKVS